MPEFNVSATVRWVDCTGLENVCRFRRFMLVVCDHINLLTHNEREK